MIDAMIRIRPVRQANAPPMSAAAPMRPPLIAMVWCLCAAACIASQAGCTSALTTAYLRDALWEGREHAAEDAADPAPTDEAPAAGAVDTTDAVAGDIAADRADAERRRAAIEEAVERLERLGVLDAVAEATLVETLQATQQEDWPVVIEAFSATLAETKPRRQEAAKPAATEAAIPLEAVPQSPAPPAEPAAAVVPEAAPQPEPTPEPVAAAIEPPASAPAAEPPAVPRPEFVVRNACFASRVQAWGQLDRFPADRFTAGQEVIVYFELDGLSAGESAAGFTTCIDTALRLVTADGRELHAWRFEPVVETCVARRRDYFARYVLRLPDAEAAGRCRVEIAVTDTLSGVTATAAVPCELE
ncbi:MAG: hypothetical protein ACKONH_07055 [Planctomycetia bacterium]